jgi:hypothetical protein
VPLVEKVTEVLAAFGSANVAVPGPLTSLQLTVTVPGGLGNPSSVMVPLNVALDGSVIVWSTPAFTAGTWLLVVDGLTTTAMSSLLETALSLAVSRNTYVPTAENNTVVLTTSGSVNVTVPGPLTCVHVTVTVAGGLGNPSSVTVPFNKALAGSVIVWSAPASTTGGWLVATAFGVAEASPDLWLSPLAFTAVTS